ncbi:MAG: nitroreductase [Bacteroidota bacterium]
MTLDQLSNIIQERRTVTPPLFVEEKVDDKIVAQLLENANWAPNHRKTEPWRFHVFSGDSLLKLGDDFQDIYKKYVPAEKFSEMKYKKLKKKMVQSSHVIAICMQRDPQERVPEWEEMAATTCAVQNLWLSATAAGLGGYWSSPGLIMNHFGEYVDLKQGEQCLGFFYLGKPKAVDLPGERGNWEDKVTWHR